MSNTDSGPTAGSTTLLFREPPTSPDATAKGVDPASGRVRTGGRAATGKPGESGLRMLKGAREAAKGMKISDSAIRAVLEDPHDVQPDPNNPQRTRLRRDGLVVTTGNDGMILRIARK